MSKDNYETFTSCGTPNPKGEFHGNANIWFYKKVDGKVYILFQKRSKQVHNGGKYDTSAGGHVDKGETFVEAALREAKEEIGISLSPEEIYFLYGFNSGTSIFQVFLSDRTDKNDTFTLDPGEVESLKWVSLESLESFIEENAKSPLRKNPFHLLALNSFFEAGK